MTTTRSRSEAAASTLTVGLVLLLTAVEGWIAWRVAAAPARLSALAAIHLAVAGYATCAAAMLRGQAARDPIFLLFIMSAVFLGPLGVAGAAIAALMRRAAAIRTRPFAEWYVALFPVEERDRTRALYERVVLRGHGPAARSSVAPFADVMAVGTLPEKQAAISLMASAFRPEFAPALQAALNDLEPAIRVQAASTVARIEHHFLQRSMALDEGLAQRPDDPALMLDGARHQDMLAAAGLLDDKRASEAARASLALHMRLLAQNPDPATRIEAIAASGRLLLRLGHVMPAFRLLNASLRSGPAAPALVGPYLESLFRLHRFVELREFCMRLRRPGGEPLPEEIEQTLRLWSDDTGPPLLEARAA